MDFFGQSPRDAGNPAQILDRCRLHAIETTKLGKQLLAPGRAHTCHVFKFRMSARLGAPRPVSDDGKTVRFVANFLYQVKAGMVHSQL